MSDLAVIRSDEDREKIRADLLGEFETAEGERSAYLLKVDKWRRQREARPENETKNYPFEKASNVCPPLTGSAVNTIFASTKGSISKKRPLIDAKAVDTMREGRQAEVLEKFLDILFESRNYINIRPATNTILYDNISLGTQFVKVPWETEKWTFKRRDKTTGAFVQVSKTVRDTPTVIPMRVEDYLTRMHFTNPQTAPWYSTVTHLFEHELRQRAALGVYNEDVVEEVLKAPRKQLTDNENLEAIRHGVTSTGNVSVFDIYETHYYYDVDDDEFPEDIILWIHRPTGLILREDFNDLGKRDIVRMTYMEMPYALYGMGIGWMSEHGQDEVEALHNAAIDSMHFNLLQMLVARRGCGITGKEEMRPGKIFLVDDPQKDIAPIKFAPVGMDVTQRELMTREMYYRFMGATDYMAGQESSAVRTRATATGTMFLAQQGNRLFDAIMENTNKAFAEIAELVFFQLVRNKDVVRSTMMHLLPAEDRPILDGLLDIEPEDIPLRYTFGLKTTDPEQTEDAKRQGILTLTQLYMNFGQQLTNVANTAFNPQVPVPPQVRELMSTFMVGGVKMMERILRDFGYDDTKPFVPDIRLLDLMREFKEAQTTAQVEAIRERMAGTGNTPTGRADTGGLLERQGVESGVSEGAEAGGGEVEPDVGE